MPMISVELDLGSRKRPNLEVVMADVRRMLEECLADADRQGLFTDEVDGADVPPLTLHALGCPCDGCCAVRAYNATQGMN